MGNRLYVGNIAFAATNESLAEYFSQAGTVTEAAVMIDKVTGRSRGFAFITLATNAEAANAISMFHGKACEGRPITVNEARPREERPAGGGAGCGERPPRRFRPRGLNPGASLELDRRRRRQGDSRPFAFLLKSHRGDRK